MRHAARGDERALASSREAARSGEGAFERRRRRRATATPRSPARGEPIADRRHQRRNALAASPEGGARRPTPGRCSSSAAGAAMLEERRRDPARWRRRRSSSTKRRRVRSRTRGRHGEHGRGSWKPWPPPLGDAQLRRGAPSRAVASSSAGARRAARPPRAPASRATTRTRPPTARARQRALANRQRPMGSGASDAAEPPSPPRQPPPPPPPPSRYRCTARLAEARPPAHGARSERRLPTACPRRDAALGRAACDRPAPTSRDAQVGGEEKTASCKDGSSCPQGVSTSTSQGLGKSALGSGNGAMPGFLGRHRPRRARFGPPGARHPRTPARRGTATAAPRSSRRRPRRLQRRR